MEKSFRGSEFRFIAGSADLQPEGEHIDLLRKLASDSQINSQNSVIRIECEIGNMFRSHPTCATSIGLRYGHVALVMLIDDVAQVTEMRPGDSVVIAAGIRYQILNIGHPGSEVISVRMVKN